jgi:hypothetical protein
LKPETGNLQIELFDATGKQLMQQQKKVVNILQDVPVTLPSLTTGMYYLKIRNNRLVTVKTIVVN